MTTLSTRSGRSSCYRQHAIRANTGEPEYGWQEDVLDIFIDDLYPNLGDDEAAIQLAEDVRSHVDIPDLVQRIERTVHQRYDIPSDTTNLIEEAIKVTTELYPYRVQPIR